MKRTLSIVLLFVYLFSATDFKELLKVNILFEHFSETKENTPLLSFSSFLLMHYVTDDNNSTDNDRDSQLPYKSGKPENNVQTVQYAFEQTSTTVCSQYVIIDNTVFSYRNLMIPSNYQALVWHPPQVL